MGEGSSLACPAHIYSAALYSLYGTLRDTGTYTTYTPPVCHLELLFPPDKCLTWPALCWVFKDNYKARSNTSPPNIWKEQVREDGGRRYEVHMQSIGRKSIGKTEGGG